MQKDIRMIISEREVGLTPELLLMGKSMRKN